MNVPRRGLWFLGAPFRAVLIGSIRIYRTTLAGLFGGQCRFEPSCSRYAEEAIRAHGAVRGSLLSAWRVFRCNPFGRPGFDPVPLERQRYDDVVRGTQPDVKARV